MNENKISYGATFCTDDEGHKSTIYFNTKWECARETADLFGLLEIEQAKLITISFSYKPEFCENDTFHWDFNLDETVKISEVFEAWEWAEHARKMLDLKFSDLQDDLISEGFEW